MRAAALCLMVILAGCAGTARKAPPDAVIRVDLDRYMGTWYVIAREPAFGEGNQVGVRVAYQRHGSDVVDVGYLAREEDFMHPLQQRSGTALVLDPASAALWSVKFPWSSADDYVIVYLDSEYRYAIAGDPAHHHALVLARDQRLSDDTYQRLLAVLTAKRYDTGKLLRVPQVEDQLGAPGYTP